MTSRYGYEEKTVDRFTMKARSIGGVRAYDEAKRQTVAAIVIENEDGSVLDMAMMTRIEKAGVWKTLQTYLVTSTELFPDIRDARMRGF